MTAVNLLSARWYGEFEFWFASVKVAAIAGFLLLAGAYVGGLLSPHRPGFGNLVRHGGFAPHGPLAVLAGVTSVFFSLTGAEIVAVAAAEARDPRRALTSMTTSVVSRIMLFYLGSTLLIVAVVPWDRIVPGVSPFTQALRAMGFPWASAAMSLVILTAVLSCLNCAFYVTSRVLFTLAARGDAPQWIVRLNRHGVPARSVLTGSIAGALGILAATTSPSRVFAFLVNASGALILFVYLITALAQIRLRARARGYPWASYAAIAGMLAVLIAMALTPGLAREFYVSLAALALASGAWAVRALIRR
jgi:L-asparagine transporter-like permease